jgi:hypothetical protein
MNIYVKNIQFNDMDTFDIDVCLYSNKKYQYIYEFI